MQEVDKLDIQRLHEKIDAHHTETINKIHAMDLKLMNVVTTQDTVKENQSDHDDRLKDLSRRVQRIEIAGLTITGIGGAAATLIASWDKVRGWFGGKVG